MYDALIEMDWSDVTVSDINSTVQLSYNKLYENINLFVPFKKQITYSRRYFYPKWYNAEIIKSIQDKHLHHKQFKKRVTILTRLCLYTIERVTKLMAMNFGNI